jgi:60 kDa SS-A/Ro ribonucleoprotein
MSRYSKHVNTKVTPQTEKIPGSDQVKNSAGGFVFQLDDFKRLDRFLILGNEGGSYYASEKEMTIKNADVVTRCLKEDGPATIKAIVEISVSGRAPKNDPAIFALAMACASKDPATRKLALEAVPAVCRIGTHLFQFVETVKNFRGWSRSFRAAIGDWYLSKTAEQLAYQIIKYRARHNWTHRDVLRLAHPTPTPALNYVLSFAAGKENKALRPNELIAAFQELQAAETAKEAVRVLRSNPALPWEAIPTTLLGHQEVWEALLPQLPLTAMIRNLGRMTANGLLAPMSDASKTVIDKLGDVEALQAARVHPLAVLVAMKTYESGKGVKGNLTWQPVQQIVDALDDAFYASFKNVQPTGKRWMLALDVSGSMSWSTIAGMPGITPRVASAAMALVTARVERDHFIMAFSDKLQKVGISPRQRLDSVMKSIDGIRMGGTDCALPMIHALETKTKVDTFVVYTDSETWFGGMHPKQALDQYRQKMGIPAKLIVVGMMANEFSIADPKDAGMLDVVGFDTATPNLMSEFSK